MSKTLFALGAAAIAAVAGSASADVYTLTFEGVGDLAEVANFYNGGTDSLGNAGPNYGVEFAQGSLGLIDADVGGSGNIANEPSGQTVLFFLTAQAAVMNVPAGFNDGFAVKYAAPYFDGFVTIYDGLNGTGNVLAAAYLPINGNAGGGDPNGQYNTWWLVGLTFDGTAKSVV